MQIADIMEHTSPAPAADVATGVAVDSKPQQAAEREPGLMDDFLAVSNRFFQELQSVSPARLPDREMPDEAQSDFLQQISTRLFGVNDKGRPAAACEPTIMEATIMEEQISPAPATVPVYGAGVLDFDSAPPSPLTAAMTPPAPTDHNGSTAYHAPTSALPADEEGNGPELERAVAAKSASADRSSQRSRISSRRMSASARALAVAPLNSARSVRRYMKNAVNETLDMVGEILPPV